MRKKTVRWATVVVCCLLGPMLAATPDAASQQEPTEPPDDSGVWEEVVRMYETAKKTGEEVPKDVYEWARQDLQRHGTWEYRVVEIGATDAKAVEEALNGLGTERWECVWVQTSGKTMRLFVKRPVRSYLRDVPLSQLLKLVPGIGAGDGGS